MAATGRWKEKMTRLQALCGSALVAVVLCMCAAHAAGAEFEWDFESEPAGWIGQGCSTERTDAASKWGRWSLAVSRQFPGIATIRRSVSLDIAERPILRYHVLVPQAAGPTLKTLVYLKNKDGLWYQCERALPLYPGGWSEVAFDLSPSSTHVQPLGHFRRWSSSAAAEIDTIGIKLFSDDAFEGTVFVDAVRFEAADAGRMSRSGHRPPPIAITDFRPSASTVPQFGLFELTFNLNRSYSNPFDPDQIRIDATFTSPDGRSLTVPAFYHQDFIRVDRVTRMEAVVERTEKTWRLLEDFVPVGPGCWKVRFTPEQVGRYTYSLAVTDRTSGREETLVAGRRSFACVRSARRGYVRVAADGRHFEFSNGEPFYPIGHNVHSSNDVSNRNCRLLGIQPQDDRGTRAYEEIFAKMAQHGQNLAEVWMASWSLDIEWTDRWKNYFGLGRYNLHHAAKLDRILELAEQNDIYIHLVLENHGKLSTFVDPEWRDNPFNEENGGFLADCRHFFIRADAREQYKKKLRYIIARWGYSTRIMGIELWSELDLTGNNWAEHNDPEFLVWKVDWHRNITEFIRQLDGRRHLLTTHYSGDFRRVQEQIVSLPGIDYITLDAYRTGGSIVQTLYGTDRALSAYGKPILVTEYGGDPLAFGDLAPAERLRRMEADLHAGIWSAYMMNHAGTPLLWWFMFIDRHNKYGHYAALAEYARGEDRRNRGLETARAPVTGPPEAARWAAALVLRDRRSAYVWVYDVRAAVEMPDPAQQAELDGLAVSLDGLTPGNYEVEFWDTYRGKVAGRRSESVTTGTLSVRLPAFRNDMALKVKPLRRE